MVHDALIDCTASNLFNHHDSERKQRIPLHVLKQVVSDVFKNIKCIMFALKCMAQQIN